MKTFTPNQPNSRGARHHHRSFSVMFLFFLMSFLLLLPGSARAEGDDEKVTLSYFDSYPYVINKDENAEKLFDSDTQTMWRFNIDEGSEYDVIVSASKPDYVAGYVITTGYDSGTLKGRNPRNWTLYGSNDLINWTVIDQVTHDTKLQDKDAADYVYTCSSAEKYEYFKWVITSENDQTIQVSEFNLLLKSNLCTEHQLKKVEAKAPTCTEVGNLEHYRCSVCGFCFKDAQDEVIDSEQSYILPAKGHSMMGINCQICGISLLLYSIEDGKASVEGFNEECFVSDLVIPEEIEGVPVTTIGSSAFERSAITSVYIPSSVTEIGTSAFGQCYSLASVTFAIDSKLEFIGSAAFHGAAITSINIPASVKKLDCWAFYSCSSLATVTFAEESKLEGIYSLAFYQTAITSITIPYSVTRFDYDAFNSCNSLTSVTFRRIPMGDSGIGSYSNGALPAEGKIQNIYVPRGFEDVYKTQLSDYADLIQGQDIEDEDHFYRFEVNEAKDGLACAGFAEKGKDIKDNVIPSMACGCPVTAVAEKAFQNHNLDYVNIPASIKTIGALAFAGNENLTDVELDGEDTQIAADAFQGDEAIECFYTVNEAAYDKYLAQAFEGKEKLVVHPTEELVLTDEVGFTVMPRPTYYDSGLMQYVRMLKNASESTDENADESESTIGESAQAQYATLCLPFALFLDQIDGVFDKVYVPMNTLIHHTKKSTPELEHFILMLQEQEPDAVIPAGHPVLVKLSDGTDQLSLSNYDDELLTAALQPKAEAMTVVDWDGTSGLMKQNKQFHISYHGTFQPHEAQEEEHLWTFNPNGTFGKQTDGTVHPFRLVLNVEKESEAEGSGSEGTGSEGSETENPATPAKQYVISIGVTDGTTTGIREFISSEAITTAHSNGSSVHAGIIYDLSGRKVGTAAGSQDVKKLRKGIYVVNGKKIVVK